VNRFVRYTLRLGASPGGDEARAALDYAHPEVVALVQALGAEGWQETADGLVFWLPADVKPDEASLQALRRAGRLEVAFEDDDWRVRWRAFHRPVAVGPFWVRPPWEAPREGALDLVIDAGMAFGTGAHATTRQCLAALARLEPTSFADLGTGSGVLALAAARLGFTPVTGIDDDPAAIDAARANAAANRLQVEFEQADLTDAAVTFPAARAAAANLSLPVILRLAARVGGRAGPPWRPRRLLLAGLLHGQGEQAAAAFDGYRVRGTESDGEWRLLDLEEAA
jgi:ribosomal protein L11 methyltransferase